MELYAENSKKKYIITVLTVSFLMIFSTIILGTWTFPVVFFVIDCLNKWSKINFKVKIPIDFLLVGIIFCSYRFGFFTGIVLSISLIVKEVVFMELEFRYIYKFIIFLIISFLASNLTFISIEMTGLVLISLRYLIEYFLDYILFRRINTNRIIKRVIYYLAGIVFILSIGNFFLSITNHF
ncbi:hypothetical protein GF327_07480 [Candidatus Woesearchaeota archaeon]|nr:hypothetical protein [Candidatus Woesearchaeota archaeon]